MSDLGTWVAEIGKAAEDLGYGIRLLEPGRVVLVARQSDAEITVETRVLSGAFLRDCLVPVPHWSGSPYTDDYMRTVPR